MSGLVRIQSAFAAARADGRAALMPYFTLGYPDPATSLAVIGALSAGGADLIELGVPFSDPLADGPTIQRSTQIALAQGTTPGGCLEMVAQLRAAGVYQPLLLMGYANPILAFGPDRFVIESVAAGVDGFIIPDLPPEEAAQIEEACRQAGVALVHMLAPTTPAARAATVAARSAGFLYLVSVMGVTGARSALPAHLSEFIGRARQLSPLPLAVGFGIATPAQGASVGRLADGVIVGSALIDAVARADDPVRAAYTFVSAWRDSLRGDDPETPKLVYNWRGSFQA